MSDYSQLRLWIIGSEVHQMGEHEAPELLLPHVSQRVHDFFYQLFIWVLHQDEVGGNTFLNIALIIPVHLHEHVSHLVKREKDVSMRGLRFILFYTFNIDSIYACTSSVTSISLKA